VAQFRDMGFRFRHSLAIAPGLRLNLARSGMSAAGPPQSANCAPAGGSDATKSRAWGDHATASVGRRGSWLTFGTRGVRATVGVPGTGLSYSEQSPWQRPKPPVAAPGIEVAELPHVEIDVPPVPGANPASHQPSKPDADEVTQADPRLMKISLAIVGLVAAAAVLWALLV
jgi:hypothetical protein